MNQFQISENEYLSGSANGLYHVAYTGMGNQGNPDYLNDLKNTFNSFSERKLQSAVQDLRLVLQEDLPQIYRLLSFGVLTVCVVPRAKAEAAYHPNQKLFRTTVQAAVAGRNGFVDGTAYIRRHSNTRTTHLRKPIANYINDGPLPYPGITAETCEISPNIRGRNILLIDDIYTPSVNIDEDAINALRNAGAQSVNLYVIGKV